MSTGCPPRLRRKGSQRACQHGGAIVRESPIIDISPSGATFLGMPLRATDARKLIRRLLDEGRFVPPGTGTHARKEMDKDVLTDVDAVNVLRGGVVREAEFENGSWRHRVETPRMVFVVLFDPEPERMPADDADVGEMELVLVTGWRIR